MVGNGVMGIDGVGRAVRNAEVHRRRWPGAARRRGGSAIALAGVGFDDAGDDVALDELALPLGGFAESRGGEAIEIAHTASRGLVEQRRGVGGEEFAVAAGVTETEAEVLGCVVGQEGLDLQASVEARVERAIAAEGEAIAKLWKPDDHERQERAAVPLVVEEDVQVVEGVPVQEVGLVEEEDGMDAFSGELLDVARDGVEEVAGGGGGREAEREAELAIEVTASEGGVMGVGQAVPGRGDAVPERAQNAGLADAGLPDEHHRGALVECLDEPSATACLELGNQRSASAISLENGASLRPKQSR